MRVLVPEDIYGNGHRERAMNEMAMQSLVRASIAQSARIFERDRNGKLPDAEIILKRRGWGDDERARMLTRASVGPAISTQTNWAQELAQVSYALLDALTPQSAGAALLAFGHNLQFSGAATIKVPGVGSGMAKWIVEGNPIPAVQFLTTGPTLSPHKLASISALTAEMLGNLNSEVFVKQALIDSTAPALDAALLSTTAASAAQPAGSLAGVSPLTASSLTDPYNAMGDDLSALAAAVAAYAGNGSIAYIGAVPQAVRCRAYIDLPYPFLMSSQLTAGTVICVATNAIASVIEQPAVDAASSTSLHEEDASPQPIGSVSPAREMFQSDCVALRIKLPVTWGIRNSGAVSYVQNVKW
jgi:hypothetical protein